MLATQDPILFVPGQLLLLAVMAASFGAFGFSAWRLYRLVRLGAPEVRWDHPAQRLEAFVAHVLGQGRLLKESYAGVMHALIFWGFIVVTIGTVEMLLAGLLPGFSFGVFTHNAAYLLLLELFQLLVLVGVGMAFYRRLRGHPLRLTFNWDALIILSLIATLMVTAFVASGFRVAFEPDPLAVWSPVSYGLASLFQPLSPGAQLGLHKLFWWAHVFTVLGFLAYLPHSKHLHIMTAPLNVWLRSLSPKGQLPYLDVEKAVEEERALGVASLRDLTWKDLLDTYTCTECGRCEAQCPASISGKALSPKKLILDIKDHLLEYGPSLLRADGQPNGHGPAPQLVGQTITDEVLWDCTTCGACMEACPVFIEHVPKIVQMRRNLAMQESRFDPEVQRLFDNLEASGNPWRMPRTTRADWAQGMGVPVLALQPRAEYLYWVGCAGSLDERNMKVARTFARLLQRAGISFAILGFEESCTGDPARRAGNEYLFQMLARQNVETLNGYNVAKIVTTCPHCFNTLANEYPQLGGNYQVIHHSQFLSELLQKGLLKPEQRQELAVAYHDPCYLGRYNGLYDQPRSVLQAVPGIEVREIPGCNREKAMCCGGGGARVFMDERRGRRINHIRIEQAMAAQPQTVATACPYCIIMLEDGARAKGTIDDVPIADVSELVERALGGNPPTAAH